MKISKRHLLIFHLDSLLAYLSIWLEIVVYSTTSAILIEEQERLAQLVRNQGIFWIVSLILIALIYKLRLDFLRNETKIISYIIIDAFIVLGSFYWYFRKRGIRGWISVAGVYSAS